MERQYIISIIWLAGFLLSYWMLKVEHEAEGKDYTNGDKVIQVLLSVLSFGMVLFILVSTWAEKVKPYWKQPAHKSKTTE